MFGGDGGAGLSRYNGKSFTRFTTKEGLLNNSIWSILEDKTGNLWIGTRETGLYLYDGKTLRIRNITPSLHRTCKQNLQLQRIFGSVKMVFGTMTIVDPQTATKITIAKVRFTGEQF